MFKIYYQAKRKQGNGSGSGLYIVKNIVNSLNGEIKVKSVNGEGTEFTIVFNKYEQA
ncbi:MAG: HAMP domain-containing histidine kinase, partial [Spirochaetales bacterium]|nr:HAMP domain-containing histidine kinase [Spirochaetales bacterium]